MLDGLYATSVDWCVNYSYYSMSMEQEHDDIPLDEDNLVRLNFRSLNHIGSIPPS